MKSFYQYCENMSDYVHLPHSSVRIKLDPAGGVLILHNEKLAQDIVLQLRSDQIEMIQSALSDEEAIPGYGPVAGRKLNPPPTPLSMAGNNLPPSVPSGKVPGEGRPLD